MPVVSPGAYAALTDAYTFGLPAAAIPAFITSQMQQSVLDSVNAEFEAAASGQYTLPLLKWGPDVVRSICTVWRWEIMCIRGFNPEGTDVNYRYAAEAAREWWAEIQEGRKSPPSIVDSAQQTQEGGPNVTSDTPRGWTSPGGTSATGGTRFWSD